MSLVLEAKVVVIQNKHWFNDTIVIGADTINNWKLSINTRGTLLGGQQAATPELKKVDFEVKIDSWEQTIYRKHVRENTIGHLAPALFEPQKPYLFREDFINNIIREIPRIWDMPNNSIMRLVKRNPILNEFEIEFNAVYPTEYNIYKHTLPTTSPLMQSRLTPKKQT